jgi:hypothetical protein
MQGLQSNPSSYRVLRTTLFIIALTLLWFCCAMVLWWAYNMRAVVAGGAFNQHYALSAVVEFGGVLTALITCVWLARRKLLTSDRSLRTAWTIWWQTAIILLLYASVVVVRRQTWTPQRGRTDWAMFFGSLNARFFSEVGSVSFVVIALPLIASTSACLFFLLSRSVQLSGSLD